MNIFSSLEIAVNALTHNKLRSILTMLGIIIGVGAVIAMLSIGTGARMAIEGHIARLGDNLLMVYPGSTSHRGVRGGMGSRATLTGDDVEAIKEGCPSVALVSPIVSSGVQIIYENQNWATRVQGVSPDFLEIRHWELKSGSPFTEQHVRAAAKLCLLGKIVVENLFADQDPVGKTVRMNRVPFKVLGVLEEKGTGWGGHQDDTVIMPYTTVQKRIRRRRINFVHNIQVTAISPDAMDEAQQQVSDLLRQRHRIKQGAENDFRIRNMADIVAASTAIVKTITTLLGSVASVSLIVGGIGIMNIMLVSVTERTREIGLRMALGARRKDILLQFIIEALVLSLVGGIIGIAGGVTASKLIATFAKWSVHISTGSIVLAFSFAAAIGVFFGYYPARRAARLDPIEALRYE